MIRLSACMPAPTQLVVCERHPQTTKCSRTGKFERPVRPEWNYIPDRRITNILKECMADGSEWVMFEPNATAPWRRDCWAEVFLYGHFRPEACQHGTFRRMMSFVVTSRASRKPTSATAGCLATSASRASNRPSSSLAGSARMPATLSILCRTT